MAEDAKQGGCLCGAARFEVRRTPRFVANCHCHSCRKATGAAFSTWVGFTNDNIRWLKEPTFYASSPGVKRGFCPKCGTPLSYSGAKWPGETHFLLGAFDDPEAFTPNGEAFVDEALSWTRQNR